MGATLAGTLITIILMLVIAYLLIDRSIERKKRIDAEEKLESLEKSLSKAKSKDARIIYQSYFAPPVDHTGDGFIDGDE